MIYDVCLQDTPYRSATKEEMACGPTDEVKFQASVESLASNVGELSKGSQEGDEHRELETVKLPAKAESALTIGVNAEEELTADTEELRHTAENVAKELLDFVLKSICNELEADAAIVETATELKPYSNLLKETEDEMSNNDEICAESLAMDEISEISDEREPTSDNVTVLIPTVNEKFSDRGDQCSDETFQHAVKELLKVKKD